VQSSYAYYFFTQSLFLFLFTFSFSQIKCEQFGIRWPPHFLNVLAVMSALTFDLSVLSGVFCLVEVSFFTNLVFSTTSVVLIMVSLVTLSKCKPHWKRTCLRVGVYLLVFAYPVLSVKCVEAFACHDVDGSFYLRADYSINCDSWRWKLIAAYASVFVVIYVAGLPIFVIGMLWHHRGQNGHMLDFLQDDYRVAWPVII
jgi:hypothetical protein